MIFDKTDKLTIIEKNFDAVRDNNYILPKKWENKTGFPIDIARFLKSEGKELIIKTEYGILEVNSDFFYGAKGLSDSDLAPKLYFGRSEDPVTGEQFIEFLLQDSFGNEIPHERPNKDALIKISRSLPIMKGPNGEYDAVEYIDKDGMCRGILPRSFVDEEYLYILISRTGRYRLYKTEHGSTKNAADFLKDRKIELEAIEGVNGEKWVNRADFFEAMMDIYWVEDLFFDTSEIQQFPDVDLKTNLKLNVAQKTGVVVGFPPDLSGIKSFKPNDELMRRDLFILIEGYIKAFGLEVDSLIPFEEQAMGYPEGLEYWRDSINYLSHRGFVPYRMVNDTPNLAGDNPVLLEECQHILYKLITTKYLEQE